MRAHSTPGLAAWDNNAAKVSSSSAVLLVTALQHYAPSEQVSPAEAQRPAREAEQGEVMFLSETDAPWVCKRSAHPQQTRLACLQTLAARPSRASSEDRAAT